VACSKAKHGPAPARSARLAASASAPVASAEAPVVRPPGTIPFDFPVGETKAVPGDFVLAPSRKWIDDALEHGVETQTFIYYGAFMQSPGPKDSKIKTLPGQIASIPNPLILPVGSGGKANPGDVVLTAWASGSGLERAIVVEGGTPERPKVRYLDMDFDGASGWGQKDDELPENTFRVLREPKSLGTTVACKNGTRNVRWIVVAEAGDKLLGLGFAGKMQVLSAADCVGLPISPSVRKGDKIFVPVVGVFAPATVTKVEAEIGRVFAKHSFGGEEKEEAFGFTNVAQKL